MNDRASSTRNRLAVAFGLLALHLTIGCTAVNSPPAAPTLVNQYGTSVAPVPTLDPAQISRGHAVYQAECAGCHGENGVGAPNWKAPDENLIFPSPPHNDDGHTWHHPDRVLYEVIRDGMRNPLRPNSEMSMPAFGATLSEADIRALLTYFKSLWTREHQEFQWLRTSEDALEVVTPQP